MLIPKPEGYVERERRPRREGERRPRREGESREGNRREGNRHDRQPRHNNFNREDGNADYRNPADDYEPKDFNDSLDHLSDID